MKKVRQEFKYILSERQALLIRAALERHRLAFDSHGKDGSYTISSLYFDTPELTDYYDKLAGLSRRKKLRARVYGEDLFASPEVFLEIKRKEDMTILKNRVTVSAEAFRMFCGTSALFDIGSIYSLYKDDPNFQKFAFLFYRYNYKPHIVVRYIRRAYEGDFRSDFRVTLDSDIEACRLEGVHGTIVKTPVAPGKVVMEIKFTGSLPWWFRSLLETFHLSRTTFSKYTHSVDVLHKLTPLPR